jgi:hypothetical protein
MRKPIPLLPLLLVLVVVLVALPAMAETFTVKLKNGNSFETRYRPQEASWDPDMVMMLTDHGHWIALPRAEVDEVVSDFEERGFGKIIDTTTIDLGIAPNDLPTPDQAQTPSALEQLQSILQQQQRSYDIQQFVSPGQAGRTGGGLPVGYGSGIGSAGGPVISLPGGGGGGG